MLVSLVGVCIHTPPPPPNQVVHVCIEKRFQSQGLFAPVWVTGCMRSARGDDDLGFVEGRAVMHVGASLDAVAVEPLTNSRSGGRSD
jgi:hypothetical protein